MTDRCTITALEAERILLAVPEGAANAKCWRWVWEILDEGSPITTRNKLDLLYGQGRVRRRAVPTQPGQFMWVYWRDQADEGQAA